jgi:hypothetical protein
LFPEDRPLPEDAVDSIQVRLSGLELRRARPFGNCWLASELWHQLGLSEFWRERLPEGRSAASFMRRIEDNTNRLSRKAAVASGIHPGRYLAGVEY